MLKRMVCLLTAGLATGGFAAALTVSEKDGAFTVRRGTETVVNAIRINRGDVDESDVKASFAVQADGTKVWNRWSEVADRSYRLEVAEHADGVVEITYASQVAWDSPLRNRAIAVDLPAAMLEGKPYRAVGGKTDSFDERAGTFASGFSTLRTRFLATDGLLFDFNPYGVGDNWCGGGVGVWKHMDSVRGVWDVSRTDAGFRMGVGSEVTPSWGGYAGAKLTIRPGEFADFDRLHARRAFVWYWANSPRHLLAFGSPKQGDEYADGDVAYDRSRGYGWMARPGTARASVGAPQGVAYSALAGEGRAVYRFGNLADGCYLLTVAAGNAADEDNRFSVSAGGDVLLENATVPRQKHRTVSRAVRVTGGTLDVAFEGKWRISSLGLQFLLADAEDYSFRRGHWVTDGFEPGSYHRNDDRPPEAPRFVPRDQTVDLPVPGTECAAPRRIVPAAVELPDPSRPSLAWTRTARIKRLFSNSCMMDELEAPGALGRYFDREFPAERGPYAIMLSGMLSRHTFPSRLDKGQAAIGRIVAEAHRRGIKVIDHIDVTLLWNIGQGFRVLTERLDEVDASQNGLPNFQFCIMNEKLRQRLFEYLRRDVELGVDGFQLDEVQFFHHGCFCANCREAFRRDTGWQLPMDECSGLWKEDSALYRAWKEWRVRNSTDFIIDMRRRLKPFRDDLVFCAYTTDGGLYSTYGCLGHGRDIFDLARTVNYFGQEVMTRTLMRDARRELVTRRVQNQLALAYGTPIWNWFYNFDWQNNYVAWAMCEMTAQTPLLSECPRPSSAPDFEAFGRTADAMRRDGARSAATVAVVFSAQSRTWGASRERLRTDVLDLSQRLDLKHIPYDVIGDPLLTDKGLSGYKAVYLGYNDGLSAEADAALARFAARGGEVVKGGEADALDRLERRSAWRVTAPTGVLSALWREKGGAWAAHFLNLSGVKDGQTAEITFTVSEGTSAVATSPDWPGERTLAVTKGADGALTVTLPAEALKAYTLVRVRK